MRRVDLTEEPAVRLARMLQAQDARLGRLETRPTGVKHLGDDGDVVWDGPGWVTDPDNPDGPLVPGPSYETWSVRDVPRLTETLTVDLDRAKNLISNRVTMARPPGPWAEELKGNGEPYPDGAIWWEWDNDTDRNVIGLWVVAGNEWVQETLTDAILGRLDVAKLYASEAVIDEAVVLKLSAEQILTGSLRTEIDETTGLYATFDSFGVRVIDNDGSNEGEPEVVVALGPNGEQLIELGTGQNKVSINSSGIGSFRTVEANEFRLSGQTVPDMMWPYTRGVVASGVIPRGNFTVRRQSRGIIMGVDARLSPGRVYSIRTNQLSVTRQNAASRPIPMLHVTLDGTDPSLDWDGTAVAEAPGVPDAVTQSIAHPGMEHIVDLRHIYRTLPTRLCRIAVTLADQSNLGWVQGTTGRGAFYCIVRDEGPEMPDTGAVWLDNNVTPPPALRRYSARYWANGIACYVRGGGRDDSQGFVQGRYSNWNRETFIFYPDMTADLAGATIHSIRAFSWFDHWYNNAGGTGSWCWHGHTSIPAGGGQFANYMRDEPGWPRAAGRTAEIVSGEFNDWKTGVRRGIAFSTGNTSLEFYGKLSGLVGVNGAHFIDVEYSK